MTAYLFIFESEIYAALIIACLIMVSLSVYRTSLVLRSVLVNSGVWLAPIFYLLYMFFKPSTSPEIILAFIFEMCVLAVYLKIFYVLLRHIANNVSANVDHYSRRLMYGIYIQLAILVYLLAQGDYGLFAEGSRIEYIADSKLSLYLTYIGMLIGGVTTPIAAMIVSRKRKWSKEVLLYILAAMVISLLSGSKGAGLLQLIMLVCMIKLKTATEYLKLMWVPIVLGLVFTGLTVFFVGDFFKLDSENMISLMYARIFLVNDGRALAIDFADALNNGGYSLFQESFRSFASMLDNPPVNLPLGQFLYREAFDTQGLLGANTSSTALLIVYGGGMEKLLFAMVLFVTLAVLYWLATMPGRHSLYRLALGLYMLGFLSQDFLAFQLCVIIISAAALLYYIFDSLRRTFNVSTNKPSSHWIK